MKNKYVSLPISFSVNNEISDKNNRFINVTIDVLHTGLNYNGSIFSKEVVNENIDTIKNTPILGFITEVPYDGKDFKGHEYVITKDANGVKRKYIGEAFGIIPESCNPRWITKITDSGIEREFLQVDGICREVDGYRIHGHLTSSRKFRTIGSGCRDIGTSNIHARYYTFLSYGSNIFVIAGPFQSLVISQLRSYCSC